jgi:hypothetical protein
MGLFHFMQGFLSSGTLGFHCTENNLNSINKNKYSLLAKAFPIVSRIIKKPNNPKSRYKYYKRQMVQFFPKENLKGMDEQSLEYQYKRFSQFYTNRDLSIERKLYEQISLFDIL